MFPYVVRINMSVPNNVSERQGVFRRKPYFLSVTFARVISLPLLLSFLKTTELLSPAAYFSFYHSQHSRGKTQIIPFFKFYLIFYLQTFAKNLFKITYNSTSTFIVATSYNAIPDSPDPFRIYLTFTADGRFVRRDGSVIFRADWRQLAATAGSLSNRTMIV